jgi:hydrogenase nickel incorporation protein HypA/HybF
MHEYSLVQALLTRVEQEARDHRATAVRRLTVRIGDLSGVEADTFATAFDLFSSRTICDGSTLVVERVPARWECATCRSPVRAGGALRCERCGGPAALIAGGEFVLDRVELEVV